MKMAVFRIEKTRDYVVMAKHHLKDKALSLKSKGLLSLILSLPEEWNYSTRGLASICKEGVDSIGTALKELENAGYIIRNKLRDERGRITDTEYIIYEFPQAGPVDNSEPHTPLPCTDSPDTENSYMDEPYTENPAQLSNITNQVSKKVNNDGLSINQSIRPEPQDELNEIDTIDKYRQLIKKNIDYEVMCERYGKERMY